ncbi:MAG: hypothetical protein GY797_00260 [Deltaproteobacteria bacterium]|nr:hypothetical protein [Deltaproteobacteria bacterium]
MEAKKEDEKKKNTFIKEQENKRRMTHPCAPYRLSLILFKICGTIFLTGPVIISEWRVEERKCWKL